ncbi:MAG: 6-bladed beta-propeller [Gemmatimonadaceae bacterium]|nr:6-bladed beta-propeller [Gemmatimonadaceae bacterium]MDQ3517872.1 6-bladed beta-propeller [Gemmatimonadota bacterium]
MSILLLNAPPVDALSQEPYRVLYSVGAEESPAEQVFDEHITVALSRSGILFVAETRIGSIRVFDSSGRFVRQFGRRGEGPGEYLSITSMAVGPAGDSLYVFDHKNRRVSVLSPTGTLLREFRPQLEWSGPLQMERHTSGALLFIGHSAKHRGLVHVVDPKGTYIRSFGTCWK